MAFLQMCIFSQKLGIKTNVNVILPDYHASIKIPEGGYPVLYLLHGYTGDYSDWVRGSNVERYANVKQLAVVMPNGAKSFYTDMFTGDAYWQYISVELPEMMEQHFPISKQRDKSFVMGLSMGGYGALKLALRNPEKFSLVASFSGVVDIVSLRKRFEKNTCIIPNTPVPINFDSIFGPEAILEGSNDDLIKLMMEIDASICPRIKLYCGDKDFLLEDNIYFAALAAERQLPCSLEVSSGDHEWVFWDSALKKAIDSLPDM